MSEYSITKRTVKVRKPHVCWGCKKELQKGETAHCVVSAMDNKIYNTYWCMACQAIVNNMEIEDLEDGFDFGELMLEHNNK